MSENAKTSVFGNTLIWFGAAVSIAEILTGTLFAPLGWRRAAAAIVIGHAIGLILLYMSGLVGVRTSRSSMEATKLTFGEQGGKVFACLNVVQLIGWTAVMIAAGTQTAQGLHAFGCGRWLWAVLMGGLIFIWLMVKVSTLQKINTVTLCLLFGVTVALSRKVFGTASAEEATGGLTFGEALELSVAMPVSWLPLISDYTSNTQCPVLTCVLTSLAYTLVSCWMYMIGLAGTLCTGQTDIAGILTATGLGAAAVVIVVLSTVTTTFLDVHSTGVSAQSITTHLPARWASVFCCVSGVVLAICCDTSSFEAFLYWIGSVFVPMATVQIMDVMVLKRQNGRAGFVRNLVLWGFGFVLYRVVLALNLPCGSTLPVVAATALLCWLANFVYRIKDGYGDK